MTPPAAGITLCDRAAAELAPASAGFSTWDDYYRDLEIPEEELGAGADRISDPHGHGPSI